MSFTPEGIRNVKYKLVSDTLPYTIARIFLFSLNNSIPLENIHRSPNTYFITGNVTFVASLLLSYSKQILLINSTFDSHVMLPLCFFRPKTIRWPSSMRVYFMLRCKASVLWIYSVRKWDVSALKS